MTPNISLSETTEMLFSVNLETMDDAAYDRCCDQANELFKYYPAKEIFICWDTYMRKNCDTAEKIINFAKLFYNYDGCKLPIEKPYDFLGYIFFKINLDPYGYDEIDFFDGFASEILKNAGYNYVDLCNNPYYSPENDPEIIKAVEYYRTKENS